MTLRKVARLLFWCGRQDGIVFHSGVAGGTLGLLVAGLMCRLPEWQFLAWSFAIGGLGVLLGRSIALIFVLWGHCSPSKQTAAARQNHERNSK